MLMICQCQSVPVSASEQEIVGNQRSPTARHGTYVFVGALDGIVEGTGPRTRTRAIPTGDPPGFSVHIVSVLR